MAVITMPASSNGQTVPGAAHKQRRNKGQTRQTSGSPLPTPKRGKAMVAPAPRLALGITVGMGVGIPGLTLALTTVAGRLAMAGHRLLAGGIVGVCSTVLAV